MHVMTPVRTNESSRLGRLEIGCYRRAISELAIIGFSAKRAFHLHTDRYVSCHLFCSDTTELIIHSQTNRNP